MSSKVNIVYLEFISIVTLADFQRAYILWRYVGGTVWSSQHF